MPLRRLLSMLTSNPHVIESLSETRLIRRAAQLTVGIYHRFKVWKNKSWTVCLPTDMCKWPSVKDVRTKSRKIDPSHPLFVRTYHKFRKIRSFFQKVRTSASEEPPLPCPQNVRTGQTPSPLTANVLYGRLLMLWNHFMCVIFYSSMLGGCYMGVDFVLRSRNSRFQINGLKFVFHSNRRVGKL